MRALHRRGALTTLALAALLVGWPGIAFADPCRRGETLCYGVVFSFWSWLAAVPIWLVSAIVAWTLSDRLHQEQGAFLVAIPASVIGGYLFTASSLAWGVVGALTVTLALAPVALIYTLAIVYPRKGAAPGAAPTDRPG